MERWALVTGVSKGVGRHMASLLLEDGCRVIGLCRSRPDLMDEHPGLLAWLPIDLAQPIDGPGLAARVKERAGRLDLIIFNATDSPYNLHWRNSDEDILKCVNINFGSIAIMLKHLIPLVNQGGQVLFVTSMAAKIPSPYMALYGALKAAQEHLARTLSVECQKKKISFSVSSPGPIRTSFPTRIGVPGGNQEGLTVFSAEAVARRTLRGLRRRRRVTNIGFMNWIACLLSRWSPGLAIFLSRQKYKNRVED